MGRIHFFRRGLRPWLVSAAWREWSLAALVCSARLRLSVWSRLVSPLHIWYHHWWTSLHLPVTHVSPTIQILKKSEECKFWHNFQQKSQRLLPSPPCPNPPCCCPRGWRWWPQLPLQLQAYNNHPNLSIEVKFIRQGYGWVDGDLQQNIMAKNNVLASK